MINEKQYGERDFLIVVVLYETDIEDSATLQCLDRIRQDSSTFSDVLIYDNSFKSKYEGKNFEDGTYYKHDVTNSGVGGAYNFAYQLCITLGKKWLILFDQDTTIDKKYFYQLQLSISQFSSHKLFCPSIVSGNKIISPSFYFAKKTFLRRKPNIGVVKSRWYTVINSGLIIEVTLMTELGGFDKALPLDFSDHYFFSKYKKENKEFVVIDCLIEHSFSSDNENSLEVVFNRFKKFSNSTIIYSKKSTSFLPFVWLIVRTFKLTFKFSSLAFFKYLFFKK